ncbi:hypothetical protein [Myxococcus sp. RHSTA-1-4]|uniref:hypothetical protein n=1 Tax=Myxococcus sp. RHSTA-1-4 TaxID=2874601 RepID=UPI001CBFA761|nr:hypothetical protein [Myxococcus sp. RHSTA-1-4]MBZ4423166.1 hypothetical protein [Myxococcus sp. RHSTA-1-4]
MAKQVTVRKVRRGGGTMPRSARKTVRVREAETLTGAAALSIAPSIPESGVPAKVDLRNLPACIQDIVVAAQDTDPGPPDPIDYHQLRGRLEAARPTLPPIYREAVLQPFLIILDRLGPQGFSEVLIRDPQREGEAGLLLDVAHSILQNGENYQLVATDAFEEVVSDLYDGFLSAEDRRGVKPPERGIIPPLVKWGAPQFGPYTWPVDVTSEVLNLEAGIVNLPPAQARAGLLAWSAVGHEVGGHDILHADIGLPEELAEAVFQRLDAEGFGALAEYWSDRIDETASDVLGILNMGPAAGIGLVGYFRGLDLAFGGEGILRNGGPSEDPHPADILRGFLAGSVVSRLRFSQARQWANAIFAEVEKDVRPDELVLADQRVTPAQARRSADVVADVLTSHKVAALEGHALGYIQNWRDQDEKKMQDMVRLLISGVGSLTPSITKGIYAAHLVAAGVVAALTAEADVRRIFDRMIRLLKQMHDQNPAWGPLFIRHRGNVVPHFVYSQPPRVV